MALFCATARRRASAPVKHLLAFWTLNPDLPLVLQGTTGMLVLVPLF